MIVPVIGEDYDVAAFVGAGVGISVEEFGQYTAIGFADDTGIIGGVVYNNFRRYKNGADIQLTAYSTNPHWLNKNNLRIIFTYPYIQLGCGRTTAVTGRANKRTRKLLEGVGYRLEGVHPKGMDGKQTAITYGMLRENCRWINLTECKKP